MSYRFGKGTRWSASEVQHNGCQHAIYLLEYLDVVLRTAPIARMGRETIVVVRRKRQKKPAQIPAYWYSTEFATCVRRGQKYFSSWGKRQYLSHYPAVTKLFSTPKVNWWLVRCLKKPVVCQLN